MSFTGPARRRPPPRRFRGLPWAAVAGRRVRVATGGSARLLGLALLDRERAGPGLLIPRCCSVHTFGMRFALDVIFLDGEGRVVSWRREVPGRRLLFERGAAAALELPATSSVACPGPGTTPRTGGENGLPAA